DGLVALLTADERFEVAGTAGTVDDFRARVGIWQPGVVVADYRLPDGKGTDLVAHTTAPVLIISGSDGPRPFEDAYESGCAGFVSKTSNVDHLTDTVMLIAAGGTVFPRRAVRSHGLSAGAGRYTTPTAREIEVLRLLAQARSVQQIADELVVSPHTVRNHVRSILTKLDARSQLEAVVKAVKLGLVDFDPDQADHE
ncbi:MAG: response regulator transcription factor, partial [Actinomycetota bacterium]